MMSPQKASSKQSDPEQIQKEIKDTREQLGDTVEAIADKADVKAQTKAKVDAAKNDAQEKVASARDSAQRKAEELGSKAKQATPESVSAGTEQVVGMARENPVPVAISAAFLVGILFGWLLSRH